MHSHPHKIFPSILADDIPKKQLSFVWITPRDLILISFPYQRLVKMSTKHGVYFAFLLPFLGITQLGFMNWHGNPISK